MNCSKIIKNTVCYQRIKISLLFVRITICPRHAKKFKKRDSSWDNFFPRKELKYCYIILMDYENLK